MTKKCLIVSGSPNNNGQTAFVIDYICKNFNGEVEVLNTFVKNGGKGVSSCIDCGGCLKREFCTRTCCPTDGFVNKSISQFIMVSVL